MATLREIRKRIRSVKNIAQVTKAMQTISASRMRRAQVMALSTRPYADKSWEVLGHLVSRLGPRQIRQQPLLHQRPVRAIELVLITGNRGLCGGYNHNVIEAAMEFVAQQTVPVRLVTVGRRGRDYSARHGLQIVGEFSELGERPTSADIGPLTHLVIDDLAQGHVDQVWLAYTDFVSTLTQRPTVRLLLPVASTATAPQGPPVSYLYEPGPESILGPMLRRFTELQIYRAVLEALASEHSARMVAMRSATDNAMRLIDELVMGYNKARQEAITKELLDIVGGAAALAR